MNQKTIIEDIKDQIISGKLAPGDKLKGRTVYEKHYQTTTNTVQHAFTKLADDGFIESFPRKGTYISQKPPHLKNYALLIYSDNIPEGWGDGNSYWKTIDRVCEEINKQGEIHLSIRIGIAPNYLSANYCKLLDDINARRIAGMLACMSLDLLKDTPIVDDKDIPIVSLVDKHQHGRPSILVDGEGFYAKAIEKLAKLGRKRIAVICPHAVHANLFERLKPFADQHGVALKDIWIQAGDQKQPESIESLIQLLLQGESEQRPDGIIITDDNFLEPACRGVIKTKLHCQDDLDIVAHANFPLEKDDLLPVYRLGFDIYDLITKSIQILSDLRQKKEFISSIMIPATFNSFKSFNKEHRELWHSHPEEEETSEPKTLSEPVIQM